MCVEGNHVTRVIPLTTYSALSNSIIIMTSTFNIPINTKISNIHRNSINNQSSGCGHKKKEKECIFVMSKVSMVHSVSVVEISKAKQGSVVVMRVACFPHHMTPDAVLMAPIQT